MDDRNLGIARQWYYDMVIKRPEVVEAAIRFLGSVRELKYSKEEENEGN